MSVRAAVAEPTFRRAGPSDLALDPHERRALARLAGEIVADPAASAETFCREASWAAKHLPDSVWEPLREFARSGSERGTLLIDGLPLDAEVPDTPPDNRQHVGATTVTARAQAILNHALGETIAYEAEAGGRLFQDMVPSHAAAASRTSLSSRVELELHTEQAFSRLRPDWLSLACLRGDRGARTFVLTARDVARIFGVHERGLLRKELWTTGVDESFRLSGQSFVAGNERGPFPILTGPDDDPLIRFDQDLDRGVNDEAEELRRRIVERYRDLRRHHVLAPGQMLIVDNRRAVHGRSPFTPRFDGKDRFVVRTFVVRDLLASRHARAGDGRVVAARFS